MEYQGVQKLQFHLHILVTETLVITYANREKIERNHLDLLSNLFSKNSGMVKAPLRI